MKYNYDVAISYSHSDRMIAHLLAETLKDKGLHVFFDEFEESTLWGPDLYQYLSKVYEQSRLCIAIISQSYTESQWTIAEFKNLLAHSRLRDSFAILPIVVDKIPPGFLGNVAYVDWSTTDNDRIATMVVERLRTLPFPTGQQDPESYHIIMRESGWSVRREGASRATSLHKTQAEAVAAARRMAKKHLPSELVVHRKDGGISSREFITSEEEEEEEEEEEDNADSYR